MVHHDHHHDQGLAAGKAPIPNCSNETSVIEALDNTTAVQDPHYCQGVIEGYADNRQKAGDGPEEISKKLVHIVQRFPHYKPMVDKVINDKGLPKLGA